MDWFHIYLKEMTEMEAMAHRVVAKRACCDDTHCSSHSHSEAERAQLLGGDD